MKSAVLLVSFGCSHADARERSLERIGRDLERVNSQIPVYQAYTSGMIIRKLKEEKIKINTVEEAVREVLDKNVKCLYVLPTHMIPGREYEKMLGVLETYKGKFEKLLIAEPVLAAEEDCRSMVSVLEKILKFKPESEYILMGHGTDVEANDRYRQMNEAFSEAGFSNVRIASVEAKPDLEDALCRLADKKAVGKVVLHPFMVVAGDHAKNDMAGEEDSYLTRVKDAGYEPEAVVKGLGEYEAFRRIYVEKLQKMLEESQ